MKKLIFHADDFNLTRGVCLGILEGFREGAVTSTSVMVNLEGLDDNLRLLDKYEIDVGLHVNLTFGRPVSEARKVPSLIDEEGFFFRDPKVVRERARQQDLEREIEAQLTKALDKGINLSHFDSHHHVHAIDERVLDVMIRLAKGGPFGIRSKDGEMRKRLNREGIYTPDLFISDFFGSDKVSIGLLETVIKSLPDGTTEIMCHPGFADDELFEKSSYNRARETELNILKDVNIKNLIKSRGIILSGFERG